MRFVADACTPQSVLEALRADGHDVIRAAPGMPDDEILALAYSDRRVLVTEDLDFGDLGVVEKLEHSGILLLRVQRLSPAAQGRRVAQVVREAGEILSASFTVVEPHRTRRNS